MSSLLKVRSFWKDINEQKWDALTKYFAPKAVIKWPNTDEEFTAEDFIRANREYPGKWDIDVIRIDNTESVIITVALVKLHGGNISFYATSYFEFEGSQITQLTEYWSENCDPPDWRKKMKEAK
jgi:hypothetical protein